MFKVENVELAANVANGIRKVVVRDISTSHEKYFERLQSTSTS